MTARITIPDLLPATQYAVQLRAVAGDAKSEWSRAFIFTTTYDTRRPDTPENVTWVADKDNFVAEWDPVTTAEDGTPTKVERYEMELVVTGPSVTRYVSVMPTTAANGRVQDVTTYSENKTMFGVARSSITMRVRAINVGGVSSNWSTAITTGNPPPSPPSNAVATAIMNGVELKWDPSTDSDLVGYRVYASTTASNFIPAPGNLIYSGNGTRTTYGTTTYTQHWFKVFAVDQFGQESTTSADATATPLSPFTTDIEAPAVPTISSATATNNANGIGATANVAWGAVTSDTSLAGYVVRYRRDGSSDAYTEVVVSEDTTSVRIDLPLAYTAYDFAVRSFDWAGNYSNWSTEATAAVPANTNPSNVSGLTSTPGRDAIRYNWTAIADADLKQYELTFSTSSTFASGNTTYYASGNTLTIAGLSPSTTYYARIRAVDQAGLTSSSWSATDTETTLNSSSTVSVSDLTGGTFSAINMYLGPGSSLITNGGNVRSNTYTGTTASNSDGVSGFYLGNDGLTINEGSVSAKAFRTSTLDTATISLAGSGVIQTSGYNGTSGFKLDASGLSIPDGSLSAKKLTIQYGQNLIPPAYADFEYGALFYTGGGIAVGSGTIAIDTTNKKINSSSLKWTATSVGSTATMSSGVTTYNMQLTTTGAATDYIISYYAMIPAGSTAATITPTLRYQTATTPGNLNGTAQAVPADGNWARYSTVVTLPATTPTSQALLFFTASAATTIYLDGIQVEERTSGSSAPSAWTPSSTTSIDGGAIKTGSIRSNVTVNLNGSDEPIWSIPMNGAATFADLKIRGNAIIGQLSDGANSMLSSANYSPGDVGYRFRSDGTADLRGLNADAISGESISVNTIRPNVVADSTGETPLNSVIRVEGTLAAYGEMGEAVQLSGEGFTVIGPHEASVTNRQMSGNVATLTTNIAHGYQAGSRINVSDVGTNYNGPWTASSVTTFTVSYVVTGSVPNEAYTTSGGLLQGYDITNSRPQPINVNFPTDGAKPNIISGTTQASTLVVTKGSELGGTTSIPPNAVMQIASGTTAPVQAPILSATYNDRTIFGIPGAATVGFSKGPVSTSVYVLSVTANSSGAKTFYVSEHKQSDGSYVATRYTSTPVTAIAGWPAMAIRGLTYYNGYFYISALGGDPGFGQFGVYTCVLQASSWSITQPFTITISAGGGGYTNAVIQPTQFTNGWNYSSNTLIVAWNQQSTATVTSVEFSVSATTGAIGSYTTGSTHTITTSSSNVGPVGASMYGPFGASGAGRRIIKAGANKFLSFVPSQGASTASESWAGANSATIAGAYYDGTDFWDLTTGNSMRQYRGGDSFQTSNTTKWVRYSWYDSVGTTHETQVGPGAGIALPNRATLVVTIPPIPRGSFGSEEPNSARVYIVTASTDPGATSTNYKLRSTITYPNTSAQVDPYSTTTTTPQAGNGFATVSNYGTIETTSRRSYWRGNDEAKFYQLAVDSTQDANTLSYGDPLYVAPPALRIGSLDSNGRMTGPHMRIDNNEIIAILSDNGSVAAQNVLYLNSGDKVQFGGKTWQTGTVTLTAPTGGGVDNAAVTFSPAFRGTPIVLTQFVTGIAAGTRCSTWASGATNTGCTINMDRGTTTATVVRWVAIDF
jgi:hypothetical protein